MENKSNNLSALIAQQFPEFIRDGHPGIVAFIEAYYEWLDAETNYLRSPMRLGEVIDIDKTMDIFLSRFRKQYLLDFPEILAFNKETGKPFDEKILIKNIKDFYRSKGTEKSYKFLFRILYDTTVNIYYPKNDILRLSDGKWIQNKYVKSIHTSGKDIFECVGKTVIQRNSLTQEVIASGTVLDVNSVTTHQTNIHQVSQIYFTATNGTFLSGTQYPIEFTNNSGVLIKEPRLFSCIQSVKIINGGINYLVGDSVEFSDASEISKASGRVYQINSLTGAIEKIRLENSGLSYESIPTASVTSVNGSGFVGEVSIGALVYEQGYYSNNDGRLSTNKVMQDNHYFQEFSYVLETDAVLKKYKEAVLKLIHPLGTAFFSKAKIQRCVTGNIDKQTDINNYEIPYISHYNCYSLNTFDNLYDWFQSEELIVSVTGGEPYYTDRLVPIHYYPPIHDAQLLEGKQNPITNNVGVLVDEGIEFGEDLLLAGTRISSEVYNSQNPMVRYESTSVASNADDKNNPNPPGLADGDYDGDGVIVGQGAQLDIIGGAGSIKTFVVNPHPNTRLTKPQLIRVSLNQKPQFLGGAAGVTGYWHEWTRSITSQRQDWAAGFTSGSKNAYLQFDRNTEFKKINIGGFLSIPLGSEFTCSDIPVEHNVPKVIIRKINEQIPPSSVKDAVGVYSVFGETDNNGQGTVSTIFERRQYTLTWPGVTGGAGTTGTAGISQKGALKYHIFRNDSTIPIGYSDAAVTTFTDKNAYQSKTHTYTVKAEIESFVAASGTASGWIKVTGLTAVNGVVTTSQAGEFRVELELQNTENIDIFSIPCHEGLKADLFMYRKDTNKGILLESVTGLEALIPTFSMTYGQNGRVQKNSPRTITTVDGSILQSRDALLLRVYYVNKLGLPVTGSESEVYFQYDPYSLAADDTISEDAVNLFPLASPSTIGGKTGNWRRNDLTDEYGVTTPIVSGLGSSDRFIVEYTQSHTGSFDYFKIPNTGLRAVIYSYNHDRVSDENLFYRAIWISPPLSVTGSSFSVNLDGVGSSIDPGDKTDPYYTKQKPLILVFQYLNVNGVPIGQNDWLDEFGYAPGATYPAYVNDQYNGITASNYRKLPYPMPWHLFNFLFKADV